jgi:hypothetical protein
MVAPNKASAPQLLDLTIDNITPNTIRINSQSNDRRLTYLMERLVTHLHDFARETRISTDEWMTAIDFLVQCGQISSDVRNVSSVTVSITQLEICYKHGAKFGAKIKKNPRLTPSQTRNSFSYLTSWAFPS